MNPSSRQEDIRRCVQVASASHYDPVRYLLPWRMASIGYQFSLLHAQFPDATILEVGVGTGLATTILRQLGHSVATLDVDERLSPEILASVTSIPREKDSFDAFLCSQVLEHLPWEESVDQALRELHRTCRLGGVISVPSNRPTLLLMKFDSKSWGTRRVTFGSRTSRRMRTRTGEHHWELEANVTTKMFMEKMADAGFSVVKSLQPYECMYHQFFVVVRR